MRLSFIAIRKAALLVACIYIALGFRIGFVNRLRSGNVQQQLLVSNLPSKWLQPSSHRNQNSALDALSVGDRVVAEVDDIGGTLNDPVIKLKVILCFMNLLYYVLFFLFIC